MGGIGAVDEFGGCLLNTKVKVTNTPTQHTLLTTALESCGGIHDSHSGHPKFVGAMLGNCWSD